MRCTCRITKAAVTHREYLILFVSTAAMVTRTRLCVTLYVHCLSWSLSLSQPCRAGPSNSEAVKCHWEQGDIADFRRNQSPAGEVACALAMRLISVCFPFVRLSYSFVNIKKLSNYSQVSSYSPAPTSNSCVYLDQYKAGKMTLDCHIFHILVGLCNAHYIHTY